jgi:hypothetical protein
LLKFGSPSAREGLPADFKGEIGIFYLGPAIAGWTQAGLFLFIKL